MMPECKQQIYSRKINVYFKPLEQCFDINIKHQVNGIKGVRK